MKEYKAKIDDCVWIGKTTSPINALREAWHLWHAKYKKTKAHPDKKPNVWVRFNNKSWRFAKCH